MEKIKGIEYGCYGSVMCCKKSNERCQRCEDSESCRKAMTRSIIAYKAEKKKSSIESTVEKESPVSPVSSESGQTASIIAVLLKKSGAFEGYKPAMRAIHKAYLKDGKIDNNAVYKELCKKYPKAKSFEMLKSAVTEIKSIKLNLQSN